jgi:hypothetical protein
MKNVQVIDGALNCTFSIFAATDEEFSRLFPEAGQEVQFAEDLANLPVADELPAILNRIWQRPVRKRDVHGIHGTLFTASYTTSASTTRSGKMALIPKV